jgi:hypothetical protein
MKKILANKKKNYSYQIEKIILKLFIFKFIFSFFKNRIAI